MRTPLKHHNSLWWHSEHGARGTSTHHHLHKHHRRHSGTDCASTFMSLTLHNHTTLNGFTHLRSTPAAQRHDRKSHTTNLIICSTNSAKTPGRHCSRRSIATTHATALTNHLNHCYCITIASLDIISFHKRSTPRNAPLTHNACVTDDEKPDKLSAGSTRQAAITFDTTNDATSNQPY